MSEELTAPSLSERAKRISPSGEVRVKSRASPSKKRLTKTALKKIRLANAAKKDSPFFRLSLPREIILEAFAFLIGDQKFIESASVVCRDWCTLIDQRPLWIDALRRRSLPSSILDGPTPSQNRIETKPLFFQNFKNLGLKNKGTEGKCFQVYERSSGKVFAMKRARVYPDGEGVPYYMLRELAFLSSASHSHICNLEKVHLHDSNLHVFFEYIDTTLHDLINPTKLLHCGKALPPAMVKVFMWQLLSAVA